MSKKSHSFEGQGLSISEDPDVWRQIARLNGKLWKINASVRLLDFHSLTSEQVEEIFSFGEKMGWVKKQPVYSVVWFDDEWDEEMSMVFSSRQEAEDEADGLKDVVESEQWVTTASFPDSTVKPFEGGQQVLDKLSVLWVDVTQKHLDGVWWDDVFDVSRLSAPRGVLCMGRIKQVLKYFVCE